VIVTSELADVGGVRCFVARPKEPGPRPAVVAYPDIFQLTPPHQRLVRRLASRGFVVVAPELYGRLDPRAGALDFDADRARALDLSSRVRVEDLDADRRAVFDAVRARSDVGDVGALGFCFGGHLAFRAALEPGVRAAACCYATGVHDGKLGDHDGESARVDTLARCASIEGELLLVWGRDDPHIPPAGRAAIHRALDDAAVRWEARLFDAEHAFLRDEGPRHDAAAADRAFDAIAGLFTRTLRALT
jgi:carboxymethylenebutenolidase